jgi:hypothetical protein
MVRCVNILCVALQMFIFQLDKCQAVCPKYSQFHIQPQIENILKENFICIDYVQTYFSWLCSPRNTLYQVFAQQL